MPTTLFHLIADHMPDLQAICIATTAVVIDAGAERAYKTRVLFVAQVTQL